MSKNLLYDVNDKPPFWKNLLFAFQQLMSIIAATMLVPVIADKSGIYLSQSASLIGACVGTIMYLICTKFKSPVFLGSSFAYITPLTMAVSYGYLGIILGSVFAGLVYVVLAIVVKIAGSDWVNKIMPPIIIGPVVALIGFDLATSAISDISISTITEEYSIVSIVIGLFTFLTTVFVSVKGGKKFKMYPFILGIFAGYGLAVIITLFAKTFGVDYLEIVDFSPLEKVKTFENWLPKLTFVGAINEGFDKINGFGDILTLFIAFVPIALVSFAEHIADHKNISSIIGKDLLKDPGLNNTLLGDGLGSIFGAMFGGCPNTTYGESIGCVALSKNASTYTILTASILGVIIALIYPVIAFFETIPSCVIGGVSIALYGFISVSGLRMIQDIDLNDSKNLFVISSVFICGIGGLELHFGSVIISNIACALIVGILTNILLSNKHKGSKISVDSKMLESDTTIPKSNKNNKN